MPQATSVNVISDSEIQVVTPAGTAGVVDVTVTNPDGGTYTFPAAFTFVASVPTPGGNQGLLSGMSPSNLHVPSGWTLVHAEDFESGSIGSGASVQGLSIQCGFAHTGNCALRGEYLSGNSPNLRWISRDLIGTRDTYISFWEYADPDGRMNSDYDIGGITAIGVTDAQIRFQPGCGGHQGGGVADIPYFWNSVTQAPILYVEGINGNPNFATWNWQGLCLSPNAPTWGNWTQWEIHIRENPPTNPASPADAQVELYQNGILKDRITPFQGPCTSNPVPCSNLAGNVNFLTTSHTADVGGVYTSWVEYANSARTQCATQPIAANNNLVIMGSLFNASPCPNQAPPNGFVGSTHAGGLYRIFDDIIVLKR